MRFDGVRFTVFNSANSAELPSNRIIRMKEGHDGSLWLTTEQGHVVRFRDGRFTNIAFANAKPDERIATLLVDSAGVVWVGTDKGLWTVRGDSLVPFARTTLDATVVSIVQRHDGSIWVGTIRAGIFRIGVDGRATRIAADPAIDTDYITSMFEDATGTLWVIGERGLWRWRDGPVQVKSSGRALVVSNIAQVPATGIVFVQAADGMYRVDADHAVLVSPPGPASSLGLWSDARAIWNVVGSDVRRDGRLAFTIPGLRAITGELLDREGSVWLGTQADGLHRLKPALFTTYSIPESVGHLNVVLDLRRPRGCGLGRLMEQVRRDQAHRSGVPSGGGGGQGGSRRRQFVLRGRRGRLLVGAIGVYACEPSGTMCRAEGTPDLRDREVFALYGDSSGILGGRVPSSLSLRREALVELSSSGWSAGRHGSRVRDDA